MIVAAAAMIPMVAVGVQVHVIGVRVHEGIGEDHRRNLGVWTARTATCPGW